LQDAEFQRKIRQLVTLLPALENLASLPNSDPRLRVLVADSVAMSCRLLADALHRSKRYQADAVVSSKEVLAALEGTSYNVALVSASFPEQPLGGFRLVRQIQELHPSVSLIVLLDTMDRNVVVEAFRAGARGVFCRSDSFEALCKCIHCVHEGQVWAGSGELQFVLDALVQPGLMETHGSSNSRPLSKREEEIARLVAEGLSNRQISDRLGLSEHTIKNYLFRVFEKLGVGTRVELALYALNRRQGRHSGPESVPPKPSNFDVG
jgi:DNA-binding NarL/FixJ family response regulator